MEKRLRELNKLANHPFTPQEVYDERTVLANKIYNLTNVYNTRLSQIHDAGLISDSQYRSAKHTYDVDKYVMSSAIHKMLDKYFDRLRKLKTNKPDFKARRKYLNNPENMAKFMRQKGVLPRYEHKTFNHVRTITPNEHPEDAVHNLATKNKYLGPMQLAVIGKRGEQVVEKVRTISRKELKNIETEKRSEKLKQPKNYRDKGNRITSIKLSRKTLK